MSDLKNLIDVKKVAAEIASDLFTTGVGRKYTHLSMNNEAELGWCVILALMDEFEPEFHAPPQSGEL